MEPTKADSVDGRGDPVDPGAKAAEFRPRYGLAAIAALLLALALVAKHADYYFGPPIVESGDYASNALQITKAKHLDEIYGNYSRWGFNHPGPAFFYCYALGERLFFDLVPLFRSPNQAHAFTSLLLQCAFFSFGFCTLCQFARLAWFPGVLAVAAALYFAQVGHAFIETWPPWVILFPLFALLVSGSAVSCGNPSFLPPLALCGCFLVHGHVAQPLFVVPETLLAAALLLGTKGGWDRLRRNRGPLAAAGLIVAAGILPIVLDLAGWGEGNYRKILGHLASHAGERHGFGQAFGYLAAFFFRVGNTEVIVGGSHFDLKGFLGSRTGPIALWVCLTVPPAIWLWSLRRSGAHFRFFRRLSLFLLVALVLTIEWGRIQDGPMYEFNGVFNHALIFLLLVPLALMLSAGLDRATRGPARLVPWILAAVVFARAPLVKGDVQYQSMPGMVENVDRALLVLRSRPVFLSFASEDLSKAGAVALCLQRRGVPFRVSPGWAFVFGGRSTAADEGAQTFDGDGDWRLTDLKGSELTSGIPLSGTWGIWRPYYTPVGLPRSALEFREGGNSGLYAIVGISETSRAGYVFSVGPKVVLYFAPAQSGRDGVVLGISGFAFTGDGRIPGQKVRVFLNGHLLADQWVRSRCEVRVRIPERVWNERAASRLTLELPGAVSPAALGISPDSRPLGLGIERISFEDAPVGAGPGVSTAN